MYHPEINITGTFKWNNEWVLLTNWDRSGGSEWYKLKKRSNVSGSRKTEKKKKSNTITFHSVIFSTVRHYHTNQEL